MCCILNIFSQYFIFINVIMKKVDEDTNLRYDFVTYSKCLYFLIHNNFENYLEHDLIKSKPVGTWIVLILLFRPLACNMEVYCKIKKISKKCVHLKAAIKFNLTCCTWHELYQDLIFIYEFTSRTRDNFTVLRWKNNIK